jgi:pyruvate, orthophosphate dikinase
MQIARIGDGSGERYPAEIVGGKAANLARMAALGLPVPPAFVLPIDLCAATVRGDAAAAEDLADGLTEGMEFLENVTGRLFGDRRRPLLVSVRSGAARSMPGMLDTVLNVGCTPAADRGLVRMTGHPRFASDCRRRFLESYGSVVLGIDPAVFVRKRDALIVAEGAGNERALDCEALERLASSYEQIIEDDDHVLSEDPMEQLKTAAQAVFRSWMSDRACTYRKLERLEGLQGTAVTIQAMVFGNGGASSGAGVAFSRDPSTGAAKPVIDVLFESQGEDVVSGGHNPETEEALARFLPEISTQLRDALRRLEEDFADIQDVEFTIEDGKLWMLQTRAAKRTPQAALRLAIDFVKEGRITPAQALQRLSELDLGTLVNKRLLVTDKPAGHGTGASAGVAVGRAAFDQESAARLIASGDPIILVRPDTTTSDVGGFAIAEGIVTAVGGRTAHAALVARQMGKPCIVGCAELSIDVAGHRAEFAGVAIQEGDWLSIDGEAGNVYLGRGEVIAERPEAELAQVERWRADSHRCVITAAAAPPPQPHDSRPS